MKNFTFYDSLRNQTGKTKRWLALLMFGGVLLLGQIGFAFLLPNIKEATNNEIVSTEAYSENTVSNNDGMPDSWANAVEDSSFDCSQISESTASGDGYGLGGLNNQDLAGDFIVSDGTTLVVDMVKVSVNTSSVANFNIIFWSDNNGLPDTVLYTINNVTSTNPVLSSGGYYMHTLDISFQNPWFNATGGDTRYWLQVTTPSAGGWERRLNTLSLGVDDAYRQNNGTWNTIYTDPPLDLYNLVYEVLGECVDCTPPSSLTATQTSTEVTLGWTGSGDSYDVEWGLNGFTLGEGTQITGLTTNSTVLDITTLDNGIYQFYVAQSCGDGEMSVWTGPFSFGIGYYSGGDIPTLYATPATSADVACTPPAVITIDVPVGYQISNINVQYDMTAWGGAWMSEQRSALYSPTINSGEVALAAGAGNGAGTFSYDRNTSFANGATGSVDFVLKAWRTWGGSDCGTTYNYVNNNTWIITPTFELLPACPTPLGLTASNITLNSAELSWMSSGELFDIEWGIQGFALGNGTLVNGVSNSHTLTDLTAETYYQYYVRQSCGVDGESTWAGPYTFYTGYCQVSSTWTGNRIEGFSTSEGYTNINNLNNGTENAYSNFSSLSVTQSEGGSFNYAVNVPSFTDIEIWIDYNNNMVFDTDELVAAHVYANAATTFTGTINLPEDIEEGDYRIRVRSRYYWNTTANPCGNITYGEAEDYTLTIIPVPACLPPSGLTATPTSLTEVTLGWTSLGNSFDLEWGPSGFTLGDGTLISDLTTNSTSVTVTIDTPYQYYVRQDCGVDGESIWAGPFSFKTGYCVPTYLFGCSNGAKVSNFETSDAILNIANNTGDATCGTNAYNNFTSMSVAALEEMTVSFTVGVGSYSAGVKVWVDWNLNGVFEADELMSESTVTIAAGGTYTGSFTVPAGTPLGDYRLRVRVVEGMTVFDACSLYNYGETEDYTITVITPPACMPPSGLGIAGVTFNSADLIWTSSGDLFDIEWGAQGFTLGEGVLVTGVANPYTTLTGLTAETNYQYYVRQDCGVDGVSFWVGPYSFYTGYCQVSSTWTGNRITDFSTSDGYTNIINLNNGTANAYSNFSALSVIQSEGGSFNYAIGVPSYTNIEIWIDYNNNMVFDTDELVAAHVYNTVATTFTGTINLPEDIDEGDYRIRVRSRYYFNTTANPCGNITYGEAEDYTLTIVPVPACLPPSGLTATPTSLTEVTLGWTSLGNSFDLEWGPSGFTLGDGTLISDLTTNSTSVTVTIDTPYQFYVRQDCGVDGESIWAGPFNFKTGYCTPIYTSGCTNGAKITLFETADAILNISNETGATSCGVNGYNNFSSFAAAAPEEMTVSFTVGIGSYSAGVKVWVDWDANGVFDASELVSESTGTIAAGGTYTGSFTVPTGTPLGDYRIRVRAVESTTVFTACSSQSWGEAEDYTITVITPPSCMPPTGLTATPTSLTEVILAWTSTGDDFDLEWGPAGFTLGDGTQMYGLTTNSTSLEVTIDTPYQFYVRQNCGVDDGLSLWAGPFNFKTGYCMPLYTWGCSNGAKISNFETFDALDNIANNTGTGSCGVDGYNNFTAMSATVIEGTTVPFVVGVGSYGAGVKLWVDWNNNGVFDTDEIVSQSPGTIASGSNYTSSFTIPMGTPVGDYRLRIRVVEGTTTFDACSLYSYGETEDYTITVITPPTCMFPLNLSAVNISATSVSLSWTSTGTLFDIEYGPAGFTPGTGTIIPGVGNPYVLSGLTGGVAYDYYVRQDCGEDDGVSMWRGPVTFTPGVFQGDIPTLLNENPQVGDIACATSFSIDVPEGYFLSSLEVEYVMLSIDPSWTSHQRSVLYSPTLEMGEATVVTGGADNYPGMVAYDREVTFANGATGTIEFVLKAWRTSGGTGCNTTYSYVMDGSWVLHPEFELIPSCPNPPADLGYTNITESSVDLTWTAEAGTFQVQWGDLGFNAVTEQGTIISDITTNSYTLEGLDSSIAYEFYVRRDCSTDDLEDYGAWVGPFRFNSGYCLPYAETAYYFTQFNTSGAVENIVFSYSGTNLGVGYKDNTDMIITEDAGSSFDFTSNYVGGASGLRIWVDWNNNFIFEDEEEEFYFGSGSGSKTGAITIPADAINGDYRMRVRAQQGATSVPSACGQINTGEALDFTLRVQGGVNSTSDFANFGFAFYPNPVGEMLYLRANTEINEVIVFNMLGQQLNLPVQSGNTQIDMTGLPSGNYVLSVTIEGINKTFKVVKK